MKEPLPDPDTLGEGEEPVIAWATIKKLQTEDGLVVIDKQYLNERIAVDLKTRKTGILKNTEKNLHHQREIIYKLDGGGWIPTELLEFD